MIHAPEVFLSLLPSHLRDTLSGTLSALLSTDPKGRPQAARDVSAALVAASRILAAQKQTAELVDELRRVVDSAAPQDLSTRTELEAMLAALRLE